MDGWIPSRQEFRTLLAVAIPVVTVQVGMMTMGVADTLMVGRVSPAALAAVAMGNVYSFAAAILGIGVIMALDPIVAQAVGAGDHAAVARSVQRGLLLAVFLSLPIAVLHLLAGPVLQAARQPADVVPLARAYTRAIIPGIFPFLAFTVFRQTLQAMGRMRPIVVTIVLANLLNIVLNSVLIFGRLGVPPLGVVGSAWATSLSRGFMALALVASAAPVLRPLLTRWRRESFLPAPLGRMLRLGLPIGGQMQLEFSAFGAVALLMGWLGTDAVAGHQVALNLASLTFMVPMGVGGAAAVLVGQAVGRGDERGARRAARAALITGAGFMAVTCALFLAIPGVLARFYTADAAVIAVAVSLLPVAGVFQVFDGLQVVAIGVLRGVGDTHGPLLANVVGFWLLGLPTSALLGFTFGAGPAGLWWGFVVGLGVVALLLLVRVRTRLGTALRRVVIDEEPGAMAWEGSR